jgi:hypothetical protein
LTTLREPKYNPLVIHGYQIPLFSPENGKLGGSYLPDPRPGTTSKLDGFLTEFKIEAKQEISLVIFFALARP